MTSFPEHLAMQHLDALAAGVQAVTQIETMMRQLEYLRSSQLARLSRITTQIARDEQHPDHGAHLHRAVEAEVAVATRTPQALTSARMGHAESLVREYPAVSAAFSEGQLSLRHTEVIVDAGQIITNTPAREAFEAKVLPLAVSMTPTQLRAHARLLAEHFAGRTIDERHAEARTHRSVRVTPLEDGMAQLVAVLAAAEAYAIKDRITRLSREALRSSATAEPLASSRGRFQTQTDVFVQLLLADHDGCSSPNPSSNTDTDTGAGADPRSGSRSGSGDKPLVTPALPTELLQQISGHIQVTVPVFTLADISDQVTTPYSGPAELTGYGPIDTKTAQYLAGTASGWDRVLTHPVSGAVLAVDRYRLSKDLKRYLRARDQHCRFPGCTKPAIGCDIDHTIPAQHGGKTTIRNTGHLCRAHHTLKHATFLNGQGWRPEQLSGGEYEWKSMISATYRTTPPSTVRFRPVPTSKLTPVSKSAPAPAPVPVPAPAPAPAPLLKQATGGTEPDPP